MSDTAQIKEESLEQLQERRTVDTLLECLIFMTRYYERETSKESLLYGLPIYNETMTYDMFCQASEKVGFEQKIVHRELLSITKLALPFILFLKGDRHCILLSYNKKDETAEVIMPGLSDGVTRMSLKKLISEYLGEAIVIKPKFNFKNKLDTSILIEKPKDWFWGTMRRNVPIYKNVILMSIFINIFVLAVPLFTMNVYDRVIPNNALETLWAFGIGIFIALSFDLVLKILRSYFLGVASKRADVIMSNRIFEQVLNIKMSAKPNSTGQFVSRLQSFESVKEFFTSATVTTFVDFPFAILFIIIVFFIGGAIGYVSVITIVIAIGMALYMQRPLKRYIEEAVKEEQIKQSTLFETISGLEIIKDIRGESRMRTHWDKSISKTVESNEKAHLLSQSISYVTGYLTTISSVAVVIIGVYLAAEGEITMGAIIACMFLNRKVISPVSKLVSMILRYDRTMLALDNLDEIMQMPVEKENKKYISRPNLKGDIEFKDVEYAYPNQNFKVLKGINLKIKQGERVAILGKIGSGKSTLLKMILNLYEPQVGSVLVDNVDIRQIDPVDLRRSVGMVPQEAFLFMGSIKDNIVIGEQYATDEEVVKVSQISGVSDFINKHEAGYDLQVGERGEGLSGGERQSVTLARALIANPNILMLDEPTNSMDRQAEKQFLNRIHQIVENKTLVLVTHKTSLLKLVDRIIILENGHIIADGPKEEIFEQLAGRK